MLLDIFDPRNDRDITNKFVSKPNISKSNLNFEQLNDICLRPWFTYNP